MDKYFVIVPDTTSKGTPVDIAGVIHERFISKEEYIKNDTLPPVIDSAPWRIGRLNTNEIPEKLYLINKVKSIGFDFYPYEGCFIFSEEFKTIFDSVECPNYIATPIEIVNRDGEKNALKKYWYVVIKEDAEAIDFDKSQFKQVNNPDGRFGKRFPTILKYGTKLVLNRNLFHPQDVFYIHQSYLRNYIFCNEATKNKIIDSEIKTIQFIEIENFVKYFNEQYPSNNTFRQMKLVLE